MVAVDFGIMGRLDRDTRRYIAEMLLGFLTGDYVRVADIHFEAGYVPRDQSRAAFTQAVRSIGEPILGRPLGEISIAHLLSQVFRITRTFEMETQPQLLLLQKTMLMAEGLSRRLTSISGPRPGCARPRGTASRPSPACRASPPAPSTPSSAWRTASSWSARRSRRWPGGAAGSPACTSCSP